MKSRPLDAQAPKASAQKLERKLRFHLHAYPLAKVDKFLRSLKVILAVHQIAPRSAARSPQRLKKLKKILRTAQQLKELSVNTWSEDIWRRSVIECVRDDPRPEGNPELRLWTLNNNAGGDYFSVWLEMMPTLNRFIHLIDEDVEGKKPRRTGRKSADPDLLLTEIAAAYARNFRGTPGLYPRWHVLLHRG